MKLIAAASVALFLTATSASSAQANVQSGAEEQAALLCNAQQAGDYVHISSTAPRSASAHGWWNNVDCKTTSAVVTVRIQVKRLGIWFNTGTEGKATVKSGGGAGNRATARYECKDATTKRTYRSWVDVDMVGIVDAPNRLYTPARELTCG